MDRKTTMLNPKLVEDFYATDKNNLNFWIARTEKYSKEKVFDTFESLIAMYSYLPNKGDEMVRDYGFYRNVRCGKLKNRIRRA